MTGSWHRIKSLVIQELYISKHSLEIIFDTFFFPLMNVILFGLITSFVGSIQAATSANYLILGILLWEIVGINQYNVTVGTLWSVWSHNLTNLFIAPISTAEYFTAQVLAALLRTLVMFVFLSLATALIFHFSVWQIGWINLMLIFINLSAFAFSLAIFLTGLIFRFGTRIQAVAWGVIFFFQPLTASFFPVDVLPSTIKHIALSLPPTYMFEAARKALDTPGINWHYMFVAAYLNFMYAVIAYFAFKRLFRRSKQTGQFARNDLG